MEKVLSKNFTFVDLFAGIGGFRQAMDIYSNHKAVCLFASEINEAAAKVYEDNFHQKPMGDIRNVFPFKEGIPSPDVVCGGFPCQTFSKGGYQAGFKDSRGTLFREIVRIIESYPPEKRPKILILENVQNLIRHDKGETWKTIRHEISGKGYNVIEKPLVVAPKDFGIPQLRNRAIILAVRNDIYSGDIRLTVPKRRANTLLIRDSIIDENITDKEIESCALSQREIHILDCWDEFIHLIPEDEHIIGFPIWSDEFGRNGGLKGYPVWKQNIIQKNRDFYEKHREVLSLWLRRWHLRRDFTPTQRKFEWQAGLDMDSVYDGIIQFRTSGIRVKRPTESPALVAMDHRPIYGPLRRYLTLKEAAKLQSFPEDFLFREPEKEAFKQLGNAVNVTVIEHVFELFVDYINNQVRINKERENE